MARVQAHCCCCRAYCDTPCSTFTKPNTTHISRTLDVFHPSPTTLGRLGEPALRTHHFQRPAIHGRLRPAVRSSRLDRPLWHEYVSHTSLSGYDTVLTCIQTTASRTCLSSPSRLLSPSGMRSHHVDQNLCAQGLTVWQLRCGIHDLCSRRLRVSVNSISKSRTLRTPASIEPPTNNPSTNHGD
jgi:hypothetical protein